jgi:PKD repeat protein
MVTSLRRRWNRQSRGQSLAEFALILPVLILTLLIVIDFGRLFYSYVTLTNATRVAANFGSVDPGSFTGTPNTATYNTVVMRETDGLLSICPVQASGGNNPPIPTFPGGSLLGGISNVTMTCNFQLMTPIIGNFFGGNLAITATAQFPIRTGAIENISGSTTLPPPGSPVAAFTFTGVSGGTINGSGNVTGTDPITVNVVDGSSNADTWEWDWGDGSPHDFTAAPLPHQFTGSGVTRTVTLKVTNTVGISTTSRTVTLGTVTVPPPVAGFYGTPAVVANVYGAGGGSGGAAIQGTRNLRVDFTNQSTNGGTAFSWAFGDGQTSTQSNSQHQYSSLGVYNVTLTITAPSGGTPFTRSGYVTVGCLVPNFAGTTTATADSSWTSADFTGSLRYRVNGNNGNGNPNPPNSPKNIVGQTIPGGTFAIPAKVGSTTWCGSDIIVDYAP